MTSASANTASNTTIVSRTTYRKVVKFVERCRDQNDKDKNHMPSLAAFPRGWGSQITNGIEDIIRQHEGVYGAFGKTKKLIEYIIEKGMLIRYLETDLQFPGTIIPSVQEVTHHVNRVVREVYSDKASDSKKAKTKG